MYILVNKQNVIVGSAQNAPSKESCSARGYKIYEVDNADFSVELIGTKLIDFEIIEKSKAKGG